MPAYVNSGTRSNSSGATSLTPALPGSRVNGNLLIAIVGSKNNATHSWPAGWTKLAQQNSGASWTVSIGWRLVDGSEAAPAISWTGSVAAFAQIVQFSGTALSPFGATNVNSGTTSTHSCTGVTTTKASSRVIYIDAAAANTALSTPSGWTSNLDNGSATGATRDSVGGKDIATSGTSSGNISVTGASAAWVMWQLELLPTTFPVIAGSVADFSDGSGNVPLPSSIAAGDLLLVAILSTVGNTGLSPATGFQLLAEQFSSPHYQTVYWKIASGGEATSQPFGAGAATTYMASLRITEHGSAGNAPEAAGANGSSATADPPAVTPAGGAKDYLWVEVATSIAGGVTGVSTSYTNEVATSDQTMRVGRRALNAASENPGTMACTNGVWLAHTIAVYPKGGSVGLAGTATSAAASSAALAVARPVAGATTALSGSSASLRVTRSLAGAPASVSAGTAALRASRPLAGSAAATSGAGGALGRIRALTGVASAVGTAGAVLRVARAMVATAAAGTSAAGALAVGRVIAALAGAVSSAAGALARMRPLQGASAATSGSLASLARLHALAASAAVLSAASATVAVARRVAGIAATLSGVASALRAVRSLAGGGAAQSAAAADLAVDGQHLVALAGEAQATSGAGGTLAVQRALAGASVASAAAGAQLGTLRHVTGIVAGASDAAAQLAAVRSLVGNADALSHASSPGFAELVPFVPDPRRISRAVHRPRLSEAAHRARLSAAQRQPSRLSIAEHRPRISAAIHHPRVSRARRGH